MGGLDWMGLPMQALMGMTPAEVMRILPPSVWLTLQAPPPHPVFDAAAFFGSGLVNAPGEVWVGTTGADTHTGTANDDDIRGDPAGNPPGVFGNDTLNGGLGNDYIEGGPGSDTLHGNEGDDALYAEAGPRTTTPYNDTGQFSVGDTLYGDDGNDLLVGQSGANPGFTGAALYGGAGNDHLIAGSEIFSTLQGGAGDDILQGNGSSIADYSDAASGVTVDLRLTTAQDTLGDGTDTLTNVPHINGSAFNDHLTGNDKVNVFTGGAGDDVMDGQGGSDFVSYFTAPGPVTVDLTVSGPQNTVSAGNDTLISIENIEGSLTYGDTLTGDGGDNTLYGFGGDDTLHGGGGNDTLIDSDGNNLLDGGAGNDTVNFEFSASDPAHGFTVDLNIAGPQSVGGGRMDTFVGIENLTGGFLNDVFTGDGGANILSGFYGDDSLSGGGGDDVLMGGVGNDTLNGGTGTDTASYDDAASGVTVSLALAGAQDTVGAGTDTLTAMEKLLGSPFADQLTAAAAGSGLSGGLGNDLLIGAAGNDVFDGGGGVDTVSYGAATAGVHVSLLTTAAQNTVGAGTDTLTSIEKLVGSNFADTLTASMAGSTLNGGPGGDDLIGGPGSDILNGGAASDFADYALAAAGVTVSLAVSGFQDTVGAGHDELVGIEKLSGSAFNDTLTGDSGPNILYGVGGADVINGGAGADYLYGGAGTDTLDGGAGQDNLIGGAGNDLFVFSALSDTTVAAPDLVTDFAAGDKLDLHLIDANTGVAGDQAFHLGGGGGHAGDIVVSAFDVANNRTVVTLYVDNNASADAAIWLTGDHHTLAASDFVL